MATASLREVNAVLPADPEAPSRACHRLPLALDRAGREDPGLPDLRRRWLARTSQSERIRGGRPADYRHGRALPPW